MNTRTTEVAPDVFQISTFIPEVQFQFNQFLIRDDEPLLYHTGMKALFPLVKEAVSKLIEPSSLRWIGFSHFEADECGAMNQWLETAPEAQVACGMVGAMVSVNDQAGRPPRMLADGEILSTGKRRFRFVPTPHLPHGWDAGHLYEETDSMLLCSDLFHQMGDVEPLTDSDLVGRYAQTLQGMEASPMAGYVPYGKHTEAGLAKLIELAPRTVLPMHGSCFSGDGQRALGDARSMLAETLR